MATLWNPNEIDLQNAGIGRAGYAGHLTSSWQSEPTLLNSFNSPVYAAENTPTLSSFYPTQPTSEPTPTPQPSGGNNGGNSGGDFMQFYQGWDPQAAKMNFQDEFGNDLNKLMTARGVGGSGGSPSDTISEETFNSIFRNLDEQLAGNAKWQQSMEQQIGAQGATQSADAEASYKTNRGNLETSRAKQKETAAQSLRDLAQNANDLLNRLSQQFGGGSALQASQTAAMRNINQTGGNIMNTRNQAYAEIDNKLDALAETYNAQKQKINSWMDEKKGQIQQAVQEWAQQIAGQKTNVRAQMISSAVQSARDYINNLATQKAYYDQQLDYWRQLRSQDLAEYAQNLGVTAQFQNKATSGGITLPSGEEFAPNQGTTPVTSDYNTYIASTGKDKEKENNPFA